MGGGEHSRGTGREGEKEFLGLSRQNLLCSSSPCFPSPRWTPPRRSAFLVPCSLFVLSSARCLIASRSRSACLSFPAEEARPRRSRQRPPRPIHPSATRPSQTEASARSAGAIRA